MNNQERAAFDHGYEAAAKGEENPYKFGSNLWVKHQMGRRQLGYDVAVYMTINKPIANDN